MHTIVMPKGGKPVPLSNFLDVRYSGICGVASRSKEKTEAETVNAGRFMRTVPWAL
jgi:hypothetical protein